VALLVASIGVIAAIILGTELGLVSGYFGGWLDDVVMRLPDALISVPELLLIAILVLTCGTDLAALSVIVAIVYTPGVDREVRAKTITMSALYYVRAAELPGETIAFVLFPEIAPNMHGPLAVELSIRISAPVLKISAVASPPRY